MKKFLVGMGWTAYFLAVLALCAALLIGTFAGFLYVFGDWGGVIFMFAFLIVGGGVIHATGDENST